jgi:hypothetical protein
MYYSRSIVLICGCRYNGKDELAKRLLAALPNSRLDSFAWAIRGCVHLKTGIPLSVLNGPKEIKDNPDYGLNGRSPRQLLIDEGDEARARLGKDIWVTGLLRRAEEAAERNTIVTDGRIPETEIIGLRRSAGRGTLVVPVRIRRAAVPVVRGTPTEDLIADAPDSLFSYLIANDGSLEDLYDVALQLSGVVTEWRTSGQQPPQSKFNDLLKVPTSSSSD